jgi:putative NIF3 family GTP cyclohydrolase 1 type 2
MKNRTFYAVSALLLSLIFSPVMSQVSDNSLTAGRVIELIRENSNVDWTGNTVDQIKTGDPGTRVTGIATCFTVTMAVLREAAAMGCNMIITHEPTWYNHLDETGAFEGKPVFEEKKKFILEHHMVIFRFHDHIHRMNPDGIEAGMAEKLGLPEQEEGYSSPVFRIKETTLADYAAFLAKRLNSGSVRYIGDPAMTFSTVSLVVGAPSSLSQIRMLEDPGVEVVMTGEAREWETVEYARDAVQQGRHKALILLGHAASEEAGMVWCARWLKEFISGVPVVFIPAGDPFTAAGEAPEQ